MRVSAIRSPIGKIPLEAPLGPELDRMRRAAATARELGTTIVRVFSFFVPPGEPPERHRPQVIGRMAALAQIAAGQGLVLAHENEKEIFGDAPGRCADLIASVNSPAGQGDGQVRETPAALRDSGFEGWPLGLSDSS